MELTETYHIGNAGSDHEFYDTRIRDLVRIIRDGNVEHYQKEKVSLVSTCVWALSKSCYSFLDYATHTVTTKHKGSKPVTKASRHSGRYHGGKIDQAGLMDLKEQVDRTLFLSVFSELTEEILLKQKSDVLRFAANASKRFEIYLWVVVADGRFDVLDKIDNIVENIQLKYKKQGIKIACIAVEEFMGIDVPGEYISLK